MFKAEVKSLLEEDISILVQLDNHPWNYLCECGDASKLTVKEIQNCNAVFISHTHIDHFVNFDSVFRHQIGVQRKVVLCGPEGIAKQIQSRIKSYTWNLVEPGAITYEIREYIAQNNLVIYELKPPQWELKKCKELQTNVLFEVPSFTVYGTLLDHKIPTLAYKFQEKDSIKIDIQSSGYKGGKWVKILKDAFEQNTPDTLISIDNKDYKAADLFYLLHIQKGDTLGIIMDHAATVANHSKIEELFANCRQVLIESFYKDEDQELAALNYHSYTTESAKVMNASKVKEAIPVHFSRKYNEEEVQELIEEFEKARSNQ